MRICDMASSSTSSTCCGIFTACAERVPRCWWSSSALGLWASTLPSGWVPTHGQEVGSLQPNGLVPGGRDDGRLGLGRRSGSDSQGPGWDLELVESGAQWGASPRPPSLTTLAWRAPTWVQDGGPTPSRTPCPLHLDLHLASGTASPWLGWAWLPPWLRPCLEAKGKDLCIRSGQKGLAGRRRACGGPLGGTCN